MSKFELKEQAKGLLLKGCYRMAFNKYCRLIDMGSEGFSQREWAIINLNQGICSQFQEQYDKAVESVDRALQIDPTYEKAYYRKLQILREMGKLELAIHSVPKWVSNKEIEGLLNEIREEYLNSLGMDQILEDLLSNKTHSFEFVKETHSKFAQRIIESIESGSSIKHLEAVGTKIATYYRHLKKEKMDQILQSFLSKIHLILIKQRENQVSIDSFNILLKSFWEEYICLAEPMNSSKISEVQIMTKAQYKIVKYVPASQKFFSFLELLVLQANISSQQMFELALQLANRTLPPLKQANTELAVQLRKTIQKFTNKLNSQLDRDGVAWIKRSFMLVDSLIKLHLSIEPALCLQTLDITNIFYLHYYFVNYPPEKFQLEATPFTKIRNEQIIAYLSLNIENFLVIYIFEHFIHRLDRNLLKEIVPTIEEQFEIMKQFKLLPKKDKKCLQVEMEKQFLLVYTSLLLKIDLKNQSNKVNISSILNQKGSLSDLQINTLLLLAISHKPNIISILQNMDCVTNVVLQFLSFPFPQQIQSIKIVTSFVYLLVVDLQEQQEENFAKKMGTSVEQIRKARKIQGENGDPEISKKLSIAQGHCKQYISKNWTEIIPRYCDLLNKIKDEACLKKWGRFLNQIGKVDDSRFFNPKIISILLECFKFQKKAVGQLFSILCKKINVGLIKYQYLQSITNILVDNIEHSDDELVIFESLLGLINITSNSSTKVRIPIKSISNAVFEQNRYIVHAACSLLNNLLATDEEEIGKQANLRDIVQKYVKFYRNEIDNDEGIPLTDYSHPSRVYSTLLSLAMVLDLDHMSEFQDWAFLEPCLLKIKTSRSEILYKSVWYMAMKERLKTKWWPKFQKDLIELQHLDQQRWLKIQQYIKR